MAVSGFRNKPNGQRGSAALLHHADTRHGKIPLAVARGKSLARFEVKSGPRRIGLMGEIQDRRGCKGYSSARRATVIGQKVKR